jgi:MoxR-like ATPase
LTLLNEREFDNGAGRVKTPLISVVAASNEVPADDALQAFYDRFLVRVAIHPVSDPVFVDLLRLPADAAGRSPTLGATGASLAVERAIDAADRAAIAAAADQVEISDDAIAACVQLRGWLAQRDLNLSDRRWRRWLGLMRTAAATEGRAQVDAIDLWLAPYVASPSPDIAPLLANWFADDLMRAVPQQAPWLTRAVQAFEKQLQLESAATDDDDAAARDAGKIAIARAIGSTGPIVPSAGAALDFDDDAPAGDGGMLRLASAQLEAHRRRRYSSVHVATRVTQVDALLAHVDREQAPIAEIAADLAQRLAGRLWLPAELAQKLTAAHAATLSVLAALAERLLAARAGFGQLPVDDRLPGVAPPSPADAALPVDDAAASAAAAPTTARGVVAAAFASSSPAGAAARSAGSAG